MGFWSGFEGLTGHQPGAFKGFSLKDIIDKDLWERRERKFPSPRYAEEGLDAPTTAWYRGRGRPEMMGPRVGAAGVPPVDPAAIVRESPRVDKTFPPFAEQHAEIMRNRYPRISQDTLRAARPWANIQSQMLRDPRQGAESMRIPTAELTADKTTVKKVFADPNKSDEIIETIKEKVPTGSAQWGNVQHPPNWQQRFDRRPVTFSSPTQPEGALTSSARPSIMNMLNMQSWQDVARRKWEERMRARRGY